MMYKPYKILMAAMSMGYGGAETHILELSKFLKQNGADVKIISNGGSYVKDFQDVGIEHIDAPFNTRKVSDMYRARKILKKTIKAFRPDIIHAHARIPAFVAAGICRHMRIPLVTTVHGTYSTSPLLRFATNWGDRSLYVSDDIKDYLMKYYKLKEGKLTKTINAVNTALFSNADTKPGILLREELGIKPGEKIILTTSRIDKHSSFSAYKLIENAEVLYQNRRDSRIVIVGTGDAFEDIKNRAAKANQSLGFEYIITVGGRTDVYRFCIACDVFVGISRAALEALSCEKDVVLCGDMGYLGRFSEDTAEKARNTNFTCRGFNYPQNFNAVFIKDILDCLERHDAADFASSRKLGTELIAEKYSVKEMADNAYSVYEKALLTYKDYDFVLTGYYGHDNAGDNALLFTILSNIINRANEANAGNYKICVLAKKPKKVQGILDNYFPNIIVKSRFNIFHVKQSIKKSDALVFGGGTLLQDNTSTRSLSYYLFLLKTARKYGKKTMLYANGIGPIYSEKNRRRVAEVVKNVSLATIRDRTSYEMLLDMLDMRDGNAKGDENSKIYLTADEAVTIKQSSYLNVFRRDFREYIRGDYIVISIRRWKDAGTAFFAEFAAAIDTICRETKLIPVYVVMERRNDKTLSENLAALNSRGYVVDTDSSDIEKILTVVRSATAVIAMRLHMTVFAAALGVPMIGISYDPKVSGFLRDIFGNDDYTVDIKEFDKNTLLEKFRALMSYREDLKTAINSAAVELCKNAEKNAALFIDAVNKIQ